MTKERIIAETIVGACSCGGRSQVLDTRGAGGAGSYVRRRRECLSCGARWTTYEVPAAALLAVGQRWRDLADAADQALVDTGIDLPALLRVSADGRADGGAVPIRA